MYEELVSRNFPLLSKEEQENLRRIRVGIAGCGMGSFIAEVLCRVGVERFLFADPDLVEVANLNHQAYGVKDVGENKAVALSNHILNINPEAVIETWADFVTQNNALDFASLVNVVIDCIDPMPGIVVSLALARVCREQRKWFLYPIDIGWGAAIFSFDPKKENVFENLLGIPVTMTLKEFEKIPAMEPLNHIMESVNIPPYLYPILKQMETGELRHYPQPIIAAFTAAMLGVSAIIKMVKNETPQLVTQFDPVERGST